MRAFVGKFVVGLMCASAIATATASPAEKPGDAPLLAPSSAWNVDYANSECRLSRTFGEGADLLSFGIVRGAAFNGVQFVILGKSLRSQKFEYSVQMRLDPDGVDRKVPGIWYNLPSGENVFLFGTGEPLVGDHPATDREIVLKFLKTPPLRLKVGKLGDALAALQTCHDDLLKSWGIDVAQLRALRTPARPTGSWNLPAYVPTRMYPKTAGDMTIRLDVSATGKVAGCTVVAPSQSKALDATGCNAATKAATFKPALSSDGRPVASPYVLRLIWPAS